MRILIAIVLACAIVGAAPPALATPYAVVVVQEWGGYGYVSVSFTTVSDTFADAASDVSWTRLDAEGSSASGYFPTWSDNAYWGNCEEYGYCGYGEGSGEGWMSDGSAFWWWTGWNDKLQSLSVFVTYAASPTTPHVLEWTTYGTNPLTYMDQGTLVVLPETGPASASAGTVVTQRGADAGRVEIEIKRVAGSPLYRFAWTLFSSEGASLWDDGWIDRYEETSGSGQTTFGRPFWWHMERDALGIEAMLLSYPASDAHPIVWSACCERESGALVVTGAFDAPEEPAVSDDADGACTIYDDEDGDATKDAGEEYAWAPCPLPAANVDNGVSVFDDKDNDGAQDDGEGIALVDAGEPMADVEPSCANAEGRPRSDTVCYHVGTTARVVVSDDEAFGGENVDDEASTGIAPLTTQENDELALCDDDDYDGACAADETYALADAGEPSVGAEPFCEDDAGNARSDTLCYQAGTSARVVVMQQETFGGHSEEGEASTGFAPLATRDDAGVLRACDDDDYDGSCGNGEERVAAGAGEPSASATPACGDENGRPRLDAVCYEAHASATLRVDGEEIAPPVEESGERDAGLLPWGVQAPTGVSREGDADDDSIPARIRIEWSAFWANEDGTIEDAPAPPSHLDVDPDDDDSTLARTEPLDRSLPFERVFVGASSLSADCTRGTRIVVGEAGIEGFVTTTPLRERELDEDADVRAARCGLLAALP